MTRRPDSPNRSRWIAHRRALTLVCGTILGAGVLPASAQIMGETSPGTPGAIEGEMRAPRASTLPPAGYLLPDQDTRSSRTSLRKTPNSAVRRPGEAPRMPGGGYAGASPMGQNALRGSIPSQRNPNQLTGAPFRTPVTASDSLPPLAQPSLEGRPAPGLRAMPPPNTRRIPAEQDPYAPLGLRLGTMKVLPALEVSAGYDSNANRSGTARKGSPVYRVEGEIKASSDWSAHKLDLDLRGVFTGYTSLDNVNRPEGAARIALRLDVTRDLTVETELKSRFDSESSSSVNVPGGTTGRTPFYTHSAILGATQRYGRFSLGLRGNVDRIIYGAAETGGLVVDQSSRDLTGYGLRLRAGYEVTPGIMPFADLSADRRAYDSALDSSGYKRSSHGMTARVGSTFEIARTLTGEVAAGYTFRAYEDARLAYLRAPVVDASLTWSISPLTTFNLKAQSEIAETTVAGSSGAISYRTTATLTHAFLRNFTATATLGLSKTDYDKIGRHETGINTGLRLDYKFNRMMTLRGSYQFESMHVNAAGSSYNAHTLLMGIRLTP